MAHFVGGLQAFDFSKGFSAPLFRAIAVPKDVGLP
jgi:hypothetical protein